MFSVLIINYKYLLCLLYLYVFIVLMTMVYCTYDYCIVNGINKRTHNWGGTLYVFQNSQNLRRTTKCSNFAWWQGV